MKMANTPRKDIRILRFPEVIRKTGLSRSELYSRVRSGEFPGKVPLGRRTVGFVEREVDDYLSDLIQRERNQPNLERA
ncbi:putative DNA binding protein from phage origin [Acidovorax sp. NO-1]|uniref:helix-turn-helix transcriptional regulator n=1 Tax=Acidovorax sp. NO-1 TaxID=512030 RepID=UPI00023FC912|nr:AlpA family phage regulatory protein [Acidovorax sp. NO-1]EHL20828.1 putative DNA binding protein from phage origin [Acidovorax sp. NO-1]